MHRRPLIAMGLAMVFIIAACGSDEPAPVTQPEADAPEQAAPTAGQAALAEEVVEGSEFINPWEEGEPLSRQEVEDIAASMPEPPPFEIKGGLPPRVESFIDERSSIQGQGVSVSGVPSYKGMTYIYEYLNYDGSITCCNCGQAAVATMLRAAGFPQTVAAIERTYPPDVNNGNWGTWPGTLQRALYSLTPARWEAGWYGGGESSLKEWVGAKNPAIVMLDLGAIPGKPWWAGHYAVVFGYDNWGYYVTNTEVGDGFRYMKAEHFRAAWKGTIPSVAGVAEGMLLLYRT